MKRLTLCIAVLLTGSVAFAEEFPAVQVYEKTAKSVVLVLSRYEGKPSGVGAGSLVDRKGTILTSAHVVLDKEDGKPSTSVHVFIKPDRITGDSRKDFTGRYVADVAAYDSNLDLAILKVRDFRGDIEAIPLARPDEVRIGQEVVAIGHPEQGGWWSLTYGRISGELENQADMTGRDVYQTDTSINRGNSGGPLLDRRGHLVGVTANIARVGAGNMPITGVNFAVKSVVAGNWMEKAGFPAVYGSSPKEKDASPPAGKKEGAQGLPPKQVVAPPAEVAPRIEEKPAGKAEVPKVAPSVPPKVVESAPSVQKPPSTEMGRAPKEDRILTPKRPYRLDEFLAEVEKDMSNMMEDMKKQIPR